MAMPSSWRIRTAYVQASSSVDIIMLFSRKKKKTIVGQFLGEMNGEKERELGFGFT